MMQSDDKYHKSKTPPSADDFKNYLDGKLSSGEERRLEAEMLNNNLYAEAMEGYEEFPSALNKADDYKEALKKKLNKNTTVWWKHNSFMVAASIALILLCGTTAYWMVNKQETSYRNELAKVNDEIKPVNPANIPVKSDVSETTTLSEADLNTEENKLTLNNFSGSINNNSISTISNSYTVTATSKALIAETMIQDSENANSLTANTPSDIPEILKPEADVAKDISMETTGTYYSYSAPEPSAASKKDEKPSSVAEFDKKAKSRKAESANAASEASPRLGKEEKKLASDILYYSDLKVLNYAMVEPGRNVEELQEKNLLKTTEAQFESGNNKSDDYLTESTVTFSYNDFLEKTMKKFAAGSYHEALKDLNLILSHYKDDVNAIFYSGLCQYNLSNYANARPFFNLAGNHTYNTFREEAIWYQALCLEKEGNKRDLKKLLEKIVEEKGFYNEKAQEKLKGL